MFSTERPCSQRGHSGAFVLQVTIGPYCKKGKVNKLRKDGICVSDLKASLCINICSTLGNWIVLQKKCLTVAFHKFQVFFFFLLVLLASKLSSKMSLPDHYFAILTYVISPRTFMKLSSEANCFLFIQTFFLTWLQDSDNFIVVSWSCALCVLPLHSSVRFSSELCVILFVSIFIAIFYNILFTRNFDSSSTSCLPADWFTDIDWYMLLFAAVRNVELC